MSSIPFTAAERDRLLGPDQLTATPSTISTDQGHRALEVGARSESRDGKTERQPLRGERQARVHQQPAVRLQPEAAVRLAPARPDGGCADALIAVPPVGELGRVLDDKDGAACSGEAVAGRVEVPAQELRNVTTKSDRNRYTAFVLAQFWQASGNGSPPHPLSASATSGTDAEPLVSERQTGTLLVTQEALSSCSAIITHLVRTSRCAEATQA